MYKIQHCECPEGLYKDAGLVVESEITLSKQEHRNENTASSLSKKPAKALSWRCLENPLVSERRITKWRLR